MNIPRCFYRSFLYLLVSFCFVANTHAQNWDINTLKSINPDNPDSKIWRATSSSAYALGFGIPVGLFVVGELSKDQQTVHNAYELAGSVIISTLLTQGLKAVIKRDRPFGKYPNDVHPYKATDDHKSMPSGHTSLAFSTATSLALEYKKWYITVPALAWASGVGYSRMYLGAHYPTDVITGAAVGAGSAFLSHWLAKKLFQKKQVINKTAYLQ